MEHRNFLILGLSALAFVSHFHLVTSQTCAIPLCTTSHDCSGDGVCSFGVCNYPQKVGFQKLGNFVATPNNIYIALRARDCIGSPFIGMSCSDVILLEDGAPVSRSESFQNCQPRQGTFSMWTHIVVDQSGSITTTLDVIKQSLKAFVNASLCPQDCWIAISTFDGRATLNTVVTFSNNRLQLLSAIDGYMPAGTDPSTNLNGAIILGIDTLAQHAAIATSPNPTRMLIVFTDGQDQAARQTPGAALASVQNSNYFVYTIGLGGEVNVPFLQSVGTAGSFFIGDIAALQARFLEIATRLGALANNTYLFGYCSPKRAGTHLLTMRFPGGAEINVTFDATGFTGTCRNDNLFPCASCVAGLNGLDSTCARLNATDECPVGPSSGLTEEEKIIIGACVGGGAVLLGAGLFWYCRKRRNSTGGGQQV